MQHDTVSLSALIWIHLEVAQRKSLPSMKNACQLAVAVCRNGIKHLRYRNGDLTRLFCFECYDRNVGDALFGEKLRIWRGVMQIRILRLNSAETIISELWNPYTHVEIN